MCCCSIRPHQYVYVGFSWHKIPRSLAYTIAEKAIRFRHPDYNLDRAQKLISSSMSRHLSTCSILFKSMHAFLSNLANRQTDKRRQTHLPPLLIISDLQHAAIWRYLEHERRLTDKEVFPSLVCHRETRCRSLFVTHLWQWRSSAHIWRLFYFAEHIILSIAPSWQFRL